MKWGGRLTANTGGVSQPAEREGGPGSSSVECEVAGVRGYHEALRAMSRDHVKLPGCDPTQEIQYSDMWVCSMLM